MENVSAEKMGFICKPTGPAAWCTLQFLTGVVLKVVGDVLPAWTPRCSLSIKILPDVAFHWLRCRAMLLLAPQTADRLFEYLHASLVRTVAENVLPPPPHTHGVFRDCLEIAGSVDERGWVRSLRAVRTWHVPTFLFSNPFLPYLVNEMDNVTQAPVAQLCKTSESLLDSSLGLDQTRGRPICGFYR